MWARALRGLPRASCAINQNYNLSLYSPSFIFSGASPRRGQTSDQPNAKRSLSSCRYDGTGNGNGERREAWASPHALRRLAVPVPRLCLRINLILPPARQPTCRFVDSSVRRFVDSLGTDPVDSSPWADVRPTQFRTDSHPVALRSRSTPMSYYQSRAPTCPLAHLSIRRFCGDRPHQFPHLCLRILYCRFRIIRLARRASSRLLSVSSR